MRGGGGTQQDSWSSPSIGVGSGGSNNAMRLISPPSQIRNLAGEPVGILSPTANGERSDLFNEEEIVEKRRWSRETYEQWSSAGGGGRDRFTDEEIIPSSLGRQPAAAYNNKASYKVIQPKN